MKKFVLLFIAFLCPVLIGGVFLEQSLRKVPNDYSYKKKYLDLHSKELQVLILGSSHSFYGVNPEYMKLRSFNASCVSQSLKYDYSIIEKYEKNFQNLKFIVLPVDYSSLYSQLEDGIEAWRVKNYTIYYGFFFSYNVMNYSEVLNNGLKVSYERLLSYKLNRKDDLNCNKLGFGLDYNSKYNNDLLVTGISAAKRHKAKDNSRLIDNVGYLQSIIDFANKKNIRIILYTSPGYYTYTQRLDTCQLNTTIRICKQFQNWNSNLIYLNLLNDKTFKKEDFFDADHLNEKGAFKLTCKLNDVLDVNN